MGLKFKDLRFSIPWNLFLLTVGSILYITGMNGVVVHHSFIPGGLYGLVLFIYYQTEIFSPGIWYALLNIPLCILGWIFISRRFVLYTIYAVAIMSVCSEIITLDFDIHEQLYAAIAGGAIIGIGSGIILRSIGSAGGLDIIAIILNKKFNIGIGKTFMLFNFALFGLVLVSYEIDVVIASVILTFVISSALEYSLAMFNQRKIVYIISEMSDAITTDIMDKMKLGATLIQGKGAYSGEDKEIIMTITNNIMLKRLEEAVFSIDDKALFIVENSFDVIGSSFKKRKIY
ncbi:YitT family protein [Desulfopila sp. IMCC35008]|uniref:YitT family protein n=1 Tax=Desulfopila sp. IMCC35008 TaxID=2653858 RepID=UPI0013D0783A|nr:YitT family protein [Desulfopila sp. IMCC35008]